MSLKFYDLSSRLQLSIYKFNPYPLVQDDLQWRMLQRGAYDLYLIYRAPFVGVCCPYRAPFVAVNCIALNY